MLLIQLNLQPSGVAGDAFPTGVSATASLGTTTATGTANVTASGVSATGSLGTATGSGAAATTGTGVSASSSLGTSGASGAANVTAAGQSSTASLGAPAETGDANTTATGVAVATALGTVTATGGSGGTAGDAFPAGVAATAALGSAAPTGDANNTPAGVAAVSALGTVTASGGSGADGNAFSDPLPLVTTNFGTAWADGGRRPKMQLKRIKEGEAHPSSVVAQSQLGHPWATGETAIPFVFPETPAIAYATGVQARAVAGHAEVAAVGTALACGYSIGSALGRTLVSADGVAHPVGISVNAKLGRPSVSVHVGATPTFDEGCEAFMGSVRATGVQNPTDEELALAAQLLINLQGNHQRSPHVRRYSRR